MLNRNKLVDQFEQVVQQEIKNHNDQILATNMSIQEFRNQLIEIKAIIASLQANFGSEVQRLKNEIDKLKASNQNIRDDVSAFISINISDKNRFEEKSNEILESVVIHNTTIKNIELHLNRIDEFNIKTRMCLVDLLKKSDEDCTYLKKHSLNSVEKLKEEILSIPSEIPELKKEFEQKIATSYVDFQGAMKELARVKRTSFVQEKQIENLHILIERLEKGSSPCHKQAS